jgi:hypothetical protein
MILLLAGHSKGPLAWSALLLRVIISSMAKELA